METLTRRSVLIGALGIPVAMTLGACSSGPSSSYQGGTTTIDHFDVAIGYNNNSSWDPLNTGSAFAMAAHNHVYEPLWDAEALTRKPFAALATAIPSDADLKGTEWTVPLRKGATWHDGKPVIADDVVFSVNRVIGSGSKVITNAFFASWLDSVTKIDDTTVKIKLKFPFVYALQRFSILKIMPKHLFESATDDFLKQGKNAVGSGPFKVAEHQDTAFTKFVKHDGYNGLLKPTASTMQWNVSVDNAARVALLTAASGAVQISDNIPQDQIEALKGKGLTVQGVDSMNMLGLAFNTSVAPFDNKLVRQALRYAIDTNKLIQLAIAGQGAPAQAFLQTTSPYFQAASVQYTYDPAKAKALLQQAGVTTPIQIRLMSSNIGWLQVAVNTIKEGWDAVGVQTTLDVMETAQFNSKLAAKDKAQAVTFSGNPNQFGQDPDLNIRWFYSNTSQFLPWNGWDKSAGYAQLNSQLQTALTADAASSKAAIGQALNTVADEAVIFPVMHMKLFTAWDPKKMQDVTPLDIPGVNLLKVKRTA